MGMQQLSGTSGTTLSEEKLDSTPARTRTPPSNANPVAKTFQRPNGLRNTGQNNGNAHRVIDMNLEKGGSGRVLQGEQVLDRAHALKNTSSMVHPSAFPSKSATVAVRCLPPQNGVARAASASATQQLSTQEWLRMIEEAKKEVRGIRSKGAKMKIDLERDEKRKRTDTEKMREEDVRELRARDAEEMKQVMEERARKCQAAYLRESKEFQEFKRACKVRAKEEEIKTFEEEYAKDLDHSSWRICRVQALVEENKMLLMERANDVSEIKKIKEEQMFQYKMMAENNRHLANMSEMTRIEQELVKEKEMLLANLQFTAACRKPVRSGAL